jgi:hypothetical protein
MQELPNQKASSVLPLERMNQANIHAGTSQQGQYLRG